jgi:hypothetical protein
MQLPTCKLFRASSKLSICSSSRSCRRFITSSRFASRSFAVLPVASKPAGKRAACSFHDAALSRRCQLHSVAQVKHVQGVVWCCIASTAWMNPPAAAERCSLPFGRSFCSASTRRCRSSTSSVSRSCITFTGISVLLHKTCCDSCIIRQASANHASHEERQQLRTCRSLSPEVYSRLARSAWPCSWRRKVSKGTCVSSAGSMPSRRHASTERGVVGSLALLPLSACSALLIVTCGISASTACSPARRRTQNGNNKSAASHQYQRW